MWAKAKLFLFAVRQSAQLFPMFLFGCGGSHCFPSGQHQQTVWRVYKCHKASLVYGNCSVPAMIVLPILNSSLWVRASNGVAP